MYAYLPLTAPVCVFADAPFAFAMPKSRSFATPLSVRNTLAGVTSRCTRPIDSPLRSRSSCA